jgi:hypothetical protein
MQKIIELETVAQLDGAARPNGGARSASNA